MLRKIRLQLFAADEGGAVGAGDINTKQDPKETDDMQGSEVKTYSEDDISKLKEQWLKEKEDEYSKKLQKDVDKAIQEEKRLSKLSDEEKEKEISQAKEKELEEREKAILTKEKIADIKDELTKRALPATFAEYFVHDDNEKTLEMINAFEKTFRKAVQDEIDAKIKSSAVKLNSGDITSSTFGKTMAQMKNAEKGTTLNPWGK